MDFQGLLLFNSDQISDSTSVLSILQVMKGALDWTSWWLFILYAYGRTLSDIQQRISNARGAFANLKKMWSVSNISLHLKVKLLNACVKSVLRYGCEAWFVTNNVTQRIQVFVNRRQRSCSLLLIGHSTTTVKTIFDKFSTDL